MAGGGGWGYLKSYLERLGVPETWSWGVLVGAIITAVIAGVAGLHGVALAAWCIGSLVVLVVAIPLAWGYLARRPPQSDR
jgi:hypothetical protein